MSVSSASTSRRPVGRRTLSFATASAVVIVATIAGLLFGGLISGGGAPAPRPAAASRPIVHDGLRLTIPGGWARGDVVSVAGFSHPLRLRNSDAGLRASVERLPATSATLLPAAFLQTLAGAPDRPEPVTLGGGRQAWRYRIARRDSSMTAFYVAPTTSGIATVACTSPLDTSVPRGCQALAAAVSVPGSRPLVPSTSAAFFTRLPTAVTDLDAARTKGTAALAAATRARGQANAADNLARAHKAAGTALSPVTSRGDGLPSATVGALTSTAAAYSALATAARARLPRPYADARRRVTDAERGLHATMAKVAAAAAAATRAPTRTPAPTPAVAARTPAPTPAAAAKTPAPTPAAAAKTPAPTPAAAKTPAPKPAKTSAPKPGARAKALAAKANPAAASASKGTDLTFVILGLLGVLVLGFAVRETRRALR